MGRRIPSSEANASNHHTALSLSLLAVWIAATIAIVAALCGSRRRKSSTTKSRFTPPSLPCPPLDKTGEATDVVAAASIKTSPPPPATAASQREGKQPPPPWVAERETSAGAALHNSKVDLPMAKSGSRRKLSVSLSMKLPEGLSRIRAGAGKEQKPAEESVWMKAIILGEKCKVPMDDDDSIVLYDGNGNRQKNYRPRTPRSLPVSRNNSFVDRDVIPS